ncbi:MAG: HAMP domain-containing protein [Zetaproteobacteria bacterium]|nr:MAG: HAMP domain-containing protein [Zetaproteobacteria bacterium]
MVRWAAGISWARWLPLFAAGGLVWLIVLLWPQPDDHAIAWIDTLLLILVVLVLGLYAVRNAFVYRRQRRAGSRLRAKLVVALVTMLLVPAAGIQFAANQMVGLAISSWFNVGISALLDRALQLGQGFYSRVENDMQQGLQLVASDGRLRSLAASLPVSFADFNLRLTALLRQHGWESLQVFDPDERMITEVRAHGLSLLAPPALDDQARIALHLGKISTRLERLHDGDAIVGYAPLWAHGVIVGLLRATVRLPGDVVRNARAIEADYKKYRALERKRDRIGRTFAHAMLMVTLLLTLVAAWVATLFARRITRPVEELATGFRQMASGNLDVTLRTLPDDELGSLSESFNTMAATLRENIAALESARRRADAALATSRQRQQVLESLLENLQAAVFIVGEDGSVRLHNRAAVEMFDLPEDGGASLERRGAIAPLTAFFDELRGCSSGSLQRTLELQDGSGRQLLARGVTLFREGAPDGNGRGRYLLVIDDVSALAMAQRHQAWAEVARRLAHEIKNPLTPIKLAAERLRRRFRSQVDREDIFLECTGSIITQVERLQRLISDFSTMARLPQPRLAPSDLRELLLEMARLYRPYGRVEVEIPEGAVPWVCDVDQLKQVLINLIDNALAASNEDQSVRLFLRREDGAVEFHVCDEGEGIPEEMLDRLFEPYFSSKEDGSGLGLAIARRIAEDHGGTLFVASRCHPTELCMRLPEVEE